MLRPLSVLSLVFGGVLLCGGALRAQEAGGSSGAASADTASAAKTANAAKSAPKQAAPADSKEHNLGDKGLAIDGWDPVAYFPEGGGKPTEGSKEHELVLNGARYRFASDAHLKLFEANPGRFAPAYGGWCAFAMAQGEKVEIDPEAFTVEGGRLMLFYKSFFNDTRAKWLKDASLLPKADTAWTKLSGEPVRGDKASASDAAGAAIGALAPGDGAGDGSATAGGDIAAAGAAAGAATDAATGATTGATAEVRDALATGHQVGQRAPAFTLKDKAGVEHSLADWRGKIVVLDFWATWCGPCKAAMPGVQKLHESFKDKGVVVVGVDGFERDAKADPAGYMASKGFTYQLLLGGQTIAESYGVESLPTFLVIDGDGVIIEREVGTPDDADALSTLIGKHVARRAGS